MSGKCLKCLKLHVFPFGLALGIVWGVSVFLIGLYAMRGVGEAYVNLIGSVYMGYGPTFLGSILGGIWGFFDGLISGIIFALLYNGFCCYMCRKHKCEYEECKECKERKEKEEEIRRL